MGFELVQKSFRMGETLPLDCVSVGKCSVSFGHDFDELLSKCTHVEVYFDVAGRRIGLKPTDNALQGFKLSVPNKNSKRYSITGTWVKRISVGQHTAEIEDGMIVFEGDIVSK